MSPVLPPPDSGYRDLPGDDLSEWLCDAMDSPPVPSTLLKKIDDGIESQWGLTPRSLPVKNFVDLSPWGTRAHATLRRAVPVLASLASVVLLSVFLLSGSTGYAWSTMLDAIARQPAFQILGGSQESPVAWVANKSTSKAHRVPPFLRLVLHQTTHADDASWEAMQVKEESWRKEGDRVLLTVTMQNDRSRKVRMRLSLHPETSLPESVQILDPTQGEGDTSLPTPKFSISYPTPASIRANQVAEPFLDDSSPRQSAAETSSSVANSVMPEEKPVDTIVVVPPSKSLVHSKSPTPRLEQVHASLPLGETPKWPSVKVTHRSPAEVVQWIDETLEMLWNENEIQPVSPASDTELLRRVYLDVAGRTPTVTEVRRYLKDTDPNRYKILVQRLVAGSDHASHWATTWRTFLIPEGVDLDSFGGREAFDRWLAERFDSGQSYDSIVRELLLAEGRLSQSGPLLFYSAAKLDPDRLAGQTSRVFLGIRLECAQCHDHPFEPWTQEDFWSYAAFFARISRPNAKLETVSTVMRVHDIDRGDVRLPDTNTIVPPRFLGQSNDLEEVQGENGESIARRSRLAKWLTSPENPYFARATVNRVWSLMFGRGIVDPVDDFGSSHPPRSPELLDALASQLIDSGFDLRSVTQTIALSQAYQLSSAAPPNDSPSTERSRLDHFAQMELKTLTAPQLYDCISVATLLEQSDDSGMDLRLARFGNSRRRLFLQQFASPVHNRVEYNAGIPQALTLMNGGLIESVTGVSTSGLLKSLDAPFFTNDQRIEVLFLATLSRRPTESESELLASAVPADAKAGQRDEALADILWALLNSAEFSLNH